jgi:hypothetical protein
MFGVISRAWGLPGVGPCSLLAAEPVEGIPLKTMRNAVTHGCRRDRSRDLVLKPRTVWAALAAAGIGLEPDPLNAPAILGPVDCHGEMYGFGYNSGSEAGGPIGCPRSLLLSGIPSPEARSSLKRTDIQHQVKTVGSRDDLVAFLAALATEIQAGTFSVENDDVGSFVEAMAAWLDDADGFYLATEGRGCPVTPSWKTFADVVMAGTMYE